MNHNGSAELPISKELLDILRCPLAVQEKTKYGDDPGRLELVKNSWLVSKDSGLKYPIRDGIPVMLIDEGMRWKETAVEDLPVPVPDAEVGGGSADSSPAAAQSSQSGGVNKQLVIGIVVALLALIVLRRK